MIRIAAIPSAALLMLTGAVSLFAQATVDLRFGATDGTVSASRLDGLEQAPRRSFAVGASVTLALREHLGLRFGGTLSGKGTTYGVSGLVRGLSDDLLGTLTYKRTYIEFSILGRTVLPLWNRRVSLYAFAGPALAFSSECEVSWLAYTGPNSTQGIEYGQCELPVGPDSQVPLGEGIDLGAVGGIGAEMAFWDMGLSAEVLHTLGLISDGLAGDAVRNRVRTVQFGFSVPFR